MGIIAHHRASEVTPEDNVPRLASSAEKLEEERNVGCLGSVSNTARPLEVHGTVVRTRPAASDDPADPSEVDAVQSA
jgi:hypothetical protein